MSQSSGFKAFSSFLPPRRDPPGFLRVNFFNPFFWLVNPKVNDWVNIIKNLLSNKVVIFLLGILGQWIANKYYHWSSLRKWRQQIFLDRVQAVLFSASPRQVESGRVEKRTMFEVDLRNVLNGNEAAAEEVRIAASKCTKQKPFITQHLAPSERYHVLNAVLNCVSCQYSSGHLIADLGGNYISDWYAFAITAESVDAVSDASLPNFVPSLIRKPNINDDKNAIEDTRTKKLRIILVKESILQSISDNHSLYVEFHGVSGRHDHRWKMLHHMGEMLLRQALDGSNRHILRVMLSVPSASVESQTNRYKPMSTPPPMLPAYLNAAEHDKHELLKDRLGGLVKQKRALVKQDPEKETPSDGNQVLNVESMLPGRPRKNTTVAMPRRKLNVTSPSVARNADNSPAMYTPRRPSIS